jgi:S-ribosylhomocysteine lyase
VTDQQRMNVESFNLDHRTVKAPYVRLADRKVLPKGDVIVKYDVRFAQPNLGHLEMKTVHSVEHLFAEKSRNHSADVIDFSPMGCQTGFYLILSGEPAYDDVLALIEATLTDITTATEVPAANEVQCGWGANHTLEGAQQAAREFLAKRDEWSQVTA